MLLRSIPAITPLLVPVLAVLGLAGCGSDAAPAAPPPLELQVARVQKRDLPLSREFVGRTVGSIDAAVRARVDGTLVGMHFEEGTEVKEGQLLYEIDPAPFIANLAAAQGELAEAQTSLAEAIADYRRVVPLAKIDAVSQRDLDLAVAKKGVAEGAVKAAEANVESKQIELSYCTITSPASGTIGFTKAKVGEYVGRPPNPTILNTVSQLEPIDVQFNLSERDYLYFARLAADGESQKGKRDLELILADGSISPGAGKVVKLDRGIDAQSGAIQAEAAFPNPGKILRPGLFAKVRTIAEVRKDAVLVPKRAIKELQGRYFVFVVNDAGVVEQRSIEVGPLSGDQQVVELGLQGNEMIAIDGIQRLRSGMTIKPKLVNLPE